MPRKKNHEGTPLQKYFFAIGAFSVEMISYCVLKNRVTEPEPQGAAWNGAIFNVIVLESEPPQK
jgi:hypothetical protein